MADHLVRGVVHFIDGTKSYGQKGFRKRLVVLRQDAGSYENFVPVEFTRDSCDRVDELRVGDEVEIHCELKGREWQGRWFLSAEGLRFQVLGERPAAGPWDGDDALEKAKAAAGGGGAPVERQRALPESVPDDDDDSSIPF